MTNPNDKSHDQYQRECRTRQCRKCNKARDLTAQFCADCGAKLEGAGKQEPVHSQKPDRQNESESPVRLDDEQFTSREKVEATGLEQNQHAHKIQPAPERMEAAGESGQAATCKGCNETLPGQAKFCMECGEPVNGQIHPQVWLTCTCPNAKPCSIPLNGQELIIGKGQDCDLTIADDEFVSRRHARLRMDDQYIYLEDLGSANGTLLRPSRPVMLEEGDQVILGQTILRISTKPQ